MAHTKEQGFTLIELMAALFIFSLIGGVALGLLVKGVTQQREALGTEAATDQASYIMEYISRAARQAKKDPGFGCLSIVKANYEVTGGGTGIKFLDKSDSCREIFLQGGVLKERIDGSPLGGALLTSSDFEVTTFSVIVSGETQADSLQPKVTFIMEVKPVESGANPLQIQTTISQRQFDVRK